LQQLAEPQVNVGQNFANTFQVSSDIPRGGPSFCSLPPPSVEGGSSCGGGTAEYITVCTENHLPDDAMFEIPLT